MSTAFKLSRLNFEILYHPSPGQLAFMAFPQTQIEGPFRGLRGGLPSRAQAPRPAMGRILHNKMKSEHRWNSS